MWRVAITAGLVASSVLAQAGAPAWSEAPDSGQRRARQASAAEAGRRDHRIDVGGVSREFIVYVPRSPQQGGALPVVVMIHGTTGDGERFYNTSGWREKADAEGLIAVFPTALVHCFFDDVNHDGDVSDPREMQVTTKWSGGALGTDDLPLCSATDLAKVPAARRRLADHPPADDMSFFRAMFDLLEATYPVDRSRIYVTGFSNGSQMAGRLAVEMGDRIAAVGAHAGPLAVSGPARRPISVLASFGNRDRGAMFFNQGRALPMDESIIKIPQFRDAVVGRWLDVLRLRQTYQFTPTPAGRARTTRFTFSTSTASADNRFHLVMVEGLEHQYPNGTNHPLVMADLLWEFFKTERLGRDDRPRADGFWPNPHFPRSGTGRPTPSLAPD